MSIKFLKSSTCFCRWSNGDRPWIVCRRLLGIILIVAAVLKAYELATVPVVGPNLVQQRWFLLVVIEFELVFGGWLLVANSGRNTWVFALILWLLLLTVAGYKALIGLDACGCFGRVQINPRYTAAFDVVVIILLLACRPLIGPSSTSIRLNSFLTWVVVGLCSMAGFVFSIWNLRQYGVGPVNVGGTSVVDGVTILEPSSWVGKQFPLENLIDINARIGKGDWIILLYRYDCEHCQLAVPRYAAWATLNADRSNKPMIAIVEIPPYAPPGRQLHDAKSALAVGRLSAGREWFTETPLAIRLRDGIVTSAAAGNAAAFPDALIKAGENPY